MKKIFKGIGIYSVVAVVALAAIFIFCAGFLFFYRKANIFGFRYISVDTSIYVEEDNKFEGLEKIQVVSNKYPIQVYTNKNTDTLMGIMDVDTSGYTNKKMIQPSFTLKYDKDLKTAVFTAVEPQGWLNRTGCAIRIVLPEAYAELGLDFVFETGKGDVSFGGDKLITVGNIDVTSKSGDVDLNKVKFRGGSNNSINFNLNKGVVSFSEKCEGENLYISVATNSGRADFRDINSDKLSIAQVKIEKLVKGRIYLSTLKELITTENINGGGRVYITESVENVNFLSLDTDVNINKISNIGNIYLNGLGKIIINETAGESVSLNVDDGSITIQKAEAKNHIISSNQGDVVIKEAKSSINVNSVYGDINIYFDEQAGDWNEVDKLREVNATTKNGHIYVEGLQRGNITATDKGRISLKYNKVCDENNIKSNHGAINIIVPDSVPGASDKAFNLNLSTKVNADINVGVVEINDSGDKVVLNIYNNSSDDTTNTLNIISNNGVVKMRSADKINV